MESKSLQILDFQPELAVYFKTLNEEWLTKYFEIEPIDVEVLGNPEKYILSDNGVILFAEFETEIVGTCALINHGKYGFELSKMAVTEKYQGLKIGFELASAIIRKAKAKGEKMIYLETNSSLKPAIRLYEKLGFKHKKPPFDHSKYVRSDVYMELEL